jgi:hypothetical protein
MSYIICRFCYIIFSSCTVVLVPGCNWPYLAVVKRADKWIIVVVVVIIFPKSPSAAETIKQTRDIALAISFNTASGGSSNSVC